MDKVKFGFRNLVYAVCDDSDLTNITYGQVKSFLQQGAGGVSINLSQAGELFEKYADDIVWFGQNINNGYDGDIAMTLISDEFKKDVLGYTVDANHVLTENADAVQKKFAFGFESQSNEGPKRTWYSYCGASRPNDEHTTKEASMNTTDDVLTIQARPRPDTKDVKHNIKKSDDEDAFNSFFSTVYTPTQPSV